MLEQMKKLATKATEGPPTEEGIERLHSLSPEELEQMVPGDPAIEVQQPDGTFVDWKDSNQQKTSDKRYLTLSEQRIMHKALRRAGKIFVHKE
jgi:hypothetical protein